MWQQHGKGRNIYTKHRRFYSQLISTKKLEQFESPHFNRGAIQTTRDQKQNVPKQEKILGDTNLTKAGYQWISTSSLDRTPKISKPNEL